MRRKISQDGAREGIHSRLSRKPKPGRQVQEIEILANYTFPEDCSDDAAGEWEMDWIDLGGEG
jgi:hypothetical protein